jgi:hypothetical protein
MCRAALVRERAVEAGEDAAGISRSPPTDSDRRPLLTIQARPQVVATGGNDFGSVDLPLPSSGREFVGHALYAE